MKVTLMIKNELLLKIYEAASMQRWNDQIRAIDITELDKQAHKMIAAYVLCKCHEKETGQAADWIKIIEYGLFEYLQRIILTDLKPPLFYEIKKDRKKYRQLNQWVYKRVFPFIECMGEKFCRDFQTYIVETGPEKQKTAGQEKDYQSKDIWRQIIGAAHFYITKWEFELISTFNPHGYQREEIKSGIEEQQKQFHKLAAMQRLLSSPGLISFISICGQLRFQVRWSHIYRVPRTSVLGHMLVVAMFSYIFSYTAGEKNRDKLFNNYFTGLFHDLPEVLTRDIINPVKRSVEGLDSLIKEYEKKEMKKRIYNLLPEQLHSDFHLFTENEFENTSSRDGKLVKASDDLAAYIEAYLCRKNGISNESLNEAMENLILKYSSPEYRVVSGTDFGEIYRSFILFKNREH